MTNLDNNLCVVGMLIDKSFSMGDMGIGKIKDGCNEFINNQKENDRVNGTRTNLFFGTFSTDYELVHNNISLKDMDGEISEKDRNPNGLTSLFDSLDSFIDDVGTSLRDMAVKPVNVIIFILTDGEENSSRRLRGEEGREKLMLRIKHQEDKYSWTFYYAGANQDSIKVGSSLGINMDTCLDYNFSGNGISSAMRTASHAISRERCGDGIGFTQEDRDTSKTI